MALLTKDEFVRQVRRLAAGAVPWEEKDRRHHQATATSIMVGDEFHTTGACRREGRLGRENCATCCILGYEPRGGFGDDYKVSRDGPNYAGWARIYVEAGYAIPRKWWRAFVAQLESADNPHYGAALARSIETYGLRFERVMSS